MSFRQMLLVLWARRWTVITTLLVTLGITLAASLLWPKSYTATTAVVLDPKPDPLSNGASLSMSGMQPLAYLATQKEIIQSERVATRVVKTLNLADDPAIIKDWRDDTEGRGDRVIWLARLLMKKLEVKPERDSHVLSITFTAHDPRVAAAIANAFAQAYIDTSLELKLSPAKQYASWFAERTRSMRGDLEKAQEHLSENQQQRGIVALDERIDVENARLSDLSAQLTTIQAQAADSKSRQAQAEGDRNILPEVLQNPLVQGLKTDIARDEAKLDQMASQLGKNHPQYKRAETELQTLREKLQYEINQLARGIGTANRINLQRVDEVKTALQQQRARVLQLKQQRAELAVIQRDVEGAQRSYDSVMQRLNQSVLESQASQSNVAILYPAAEPVDPSRPKLLLNMFLAAFFALPLGIGFALRREIIDYRIRLTEDVTELLKLPVLGTVDRVAALPPPGDQPRQPALPWRFWRRRAPLSVLIPAEI